MIKCFVSFFSPQQLKDCQALTLIFLTVGLYPPCRRTWKRMVGIVSFPFGALSLLSGAFAVRFRACRSFKTATGELDGTCNLEIFSPWSSPGYFWWEVTVNTKLSIHLKATLWMKPSQTPLCYHLTASLSLKSCCCRWTGRWSWCQSACGGRYQHLSSLGLSVGKLWIEELQYNPIGSM